MNDDIDQLLKNLKFRRTREIITEELERAEKKKPSYSEFLARVLREEYQHQQERFLEYRIDRANIPERWTLETFPWKEQPSCSKPQIEQLAQLDFIARAANLVFIGETGVGKTGLASASSCSYFKKHRTRIKLISRIQNIFKFLLCNL